MIVLQKVSLYGRLVRFSHTVFALPFAVMGAVLAERRLPDFVTGALIVTAMVGARTAAMAMNRLADHAIDAENPRTRGRELPRGEIHRTEVWLLLLGAVALFVAACALLNPLVLMLSPVALLVVLSYPYAKRYTSLCHLWLGAGLALSPVGAWVAVRGEFGEGFLAAFLLGAGVLLWTAGFDVIYALLDVDFDRRRGLFSIPARWGPRGALTLSTIFHVITVACFAGAGIVAGLGVAYYAGVALTAALLVYEHSIVRPDDLSRVNVAFFTLNGAVSILLMIALLLDVLVLSGAP